MASHERYCLPQELESDQQAAVLYSPFRDKALNPQSWTRKVKFWENLLAESALERRNVTCDVSVLPSLFERKGIRPKCLGTIVEEMKKSGRIRSVESYKRKNDWWSWGLNTLVKQPLTWGLSHLIGSTDKESGIFVWPEVVKKLCEEVIQLHQESVENELSDSLVSIAHLQSKCLLLIPCAQDFDIVLTQLERDKRVAIIETQDQEIVIKFCKTGETAVSPISDIDLHIYRIQLSLRQLEKDIQVLSCRAQEQVNEARRHLREGSKSMAKHCLRKKKSLLRMMDRRSESLTYLHDILQTIEEASTNEKVLKACQASTALMKSINKHVTVEGVESVMDDIREAIDNQEDINLALSSCHSQDDQQQLELDLQQLLDESQDTEQMKLSTEGIKQEEDLIQLFQHAMQEGQSAVRSQQTLIAPAPGVASLELPDVPTSRPSRDASHDTSHHQGTSKTSSQSLSS
uniref:CHMP7 winged helix domain-containing protein n=1 Tax=Arion vulgaris TaxID=1028688 RepID=A0A0B6ZQG5_9EUPU